MRVWLAAIAFACLLAGCQEAGLPAVVQPGASTGAWLETGSALWVAWSSGCGFCSGSPDGPEFVVVGLYRDGRVLTVSYSQGTGGNGSVQFASTAPLGLREASEAILALDVYGKGDRGLRVHGIRAETLSQADARGVAAVLNHVLMEASDPPASDQTICSDCGSFVLESFAPPVTHRFAPNLNAQTPGPALARASEQMAALWAWANPSPSP